jgi:glycosyltransferase involved in cell wall biosynthesis
MPMTPKRRLRVLTLLDGIGAGGGGERLARQILVRLDAERFDRWLCVSRWSAEDAAAPAAKTAVAELDEAGVHFLGLDRTSALHLRPWRALLTLLREERIDILHAHKFGSNVWASILGSLAGTPVVIAHEHTWSFEGQPVRKLLDRRLIAPRVAAFLTVSREDTRRMIEVEKIHPDKLIMVPNGIDALPPASGRNIREELGIQPEAPVIGTVCTLRPQKALDVLIRAAADLSRSWRELRVLIVGGGPQRAGLEALIGELGLEGVVMILGFRPDVPDLLQAVDVAVCSSDFEGTPLSILEYMDAGLPVVATRVGGIPDVIDDGVEGLLVEPRDQVRLAASIDALLRDRPRAEQMGRRGRERRRKEFDIGVTVRRIEDLYEGLTAAAVTRRSRSDGASANARSA